MKLSVIIPTYKEPDYLDLCIKSALEGRDGGDLEIIVVVDGTEGINSSIVEKYRDNEIVKFIIFPKNQGLSVATNYGVYSSEGDYILVVNDDNVFPNNWDSSIINYCDTHINNFVLSPNQIEPRPSMFSQFVIKDFGTSANDFDSFNFYSFERKLAKEALEGKKMDFSGSTLPFVMNRNDFLAVGGWDVMYPSPHVVDWDFFLKCEYFKFSMIRAYDVNFYHFAGVATRSEKMRVESQQKELKAHEFFASKWKNRASHDPLTNSKLLPIFKNGN